MERKAIIAPVLTSSAPMNPVLIGQTTQIKREKETPLKSANIVNIGPEPKSQQRVGNTPLYIISEKNKARHVIEKVSPG
jgi:hypothetical protein